MFKKYQYFFYPPYTYYFLLSDPKPSSSLYSFFSYPFPPTILTSINAPVKLFPSISFPPTDLNTENLFSFVSNFSHPILFLKNEPSPPPFFIPLLPICPFYNSFPFHFFPFISILILFPYFSPAPYITK